MTARRRSHTATVSALPTDHYRALVAFRGPLSSSSALEPTWRDSQGKRTD